jgi:O-antigen ligase
MTMTTNLVISSGRTGYVAYFAALVILLFTYYKLSLKNFLQLLIFPTLVFMLAYNLDNAVKSRVNASFQAIEKIKDSEDYNTSSGVRIAMFSVAQDILEQSENSIIWGAGTGDVFTEMEASMARTKILNIHLKHLHNSYLTAYVNIGIIGLFLLFLLLYFLWNTKINDKEILFIQQLFVLVISISMLGDIMLSITVTMLFFGIIAALIIVNEEQTKDYYAQPHS